jgi:hypothetical protein
MRVTIMWGGWKSCETSEHDSDLLQDLTTTDEGGARCAIFFRCQRVLESLPEEHASRGSGSLVSNS